MLSNKRGMTLIELLATIAITLLIMAALFSFSIAMQRGGVATRRVANSGQAVEMAMTQLRNELAGALWLDTVDGNLKYESVRYESRWSIIIEEGDLIRVLEDDEVDDQAVLARNIDEFSYALPNPGDRIISVTVKSGDIEMQDHIFLRNWRGEFPDWHASVWYIPGDIVRHRNVLWKALQNAKGGGDNEPDREENSQFYWERYYP